MRISFEVVVLLAAISGRTLVLPPEQVMYLLQPKKGDKRQGKRQYTDYYNLTDNMELMRYVPIITVEEFIQLEGGDDGLISLKGYNETWTNHLHEISKSCEERKKSDVFCEDLYDHYVSHGQVSTITSEFKYAKCLVFDADVFVQGSDHIHKLSPHSKGRIQQFCGQERDPFYYNQSLHDIPVWHFETRDLRYRLLVHFYAVLFFTDAKIGNYYKRFARDFFRYHDEVFCAAAKIILALQYENSMLSGNTNPTADLDPELVGGYSSLHVRRGDLQFKEARLNASEWYENTKELWKPNEILYVATDERNKTFFDDFQSDDFLPSSVLSGVEGIRSLPSSGLQRGTVIVNPEALLATPDYVLPENGLTVRDYYNWLYYNQFLSFDELEQTEPESQEREKMVDLFSSAQPGLWNRISDISVDK